VIQFFTARADSWARHGKPLPSLGSNGNRPKPKVTTTKDAQHRYRSIRSCGYGGDFRAGSATAGRSNLAGPLAARSPGLRLTLGLEIERHCRADEILQGRLIDLFAFMDVDGAPGIPVV